MPTSPPAKCHYTRQIYTCTHSAWLEAPRISHLAPCRLSGNPFGNSRSRTRCTNIGPSHAVAVPGLCPKCSPAVLGESSRRSRKEQVEREAKKGRKSWSLETRKGGKEAKAERASSSSATDLARVERPIGDSATDLSREIEATTPDGGRESTKLGTWISIRARGIPWAANGGNSPSIFRRVVGALLPRASEEFSRPAADAKSGARDDESRSGWVPVDADPDWEVVSGAEKREVRAGHTA
ncbi:hypothetical protein QTJ16_002197 [Diplocarpon rosae]|nr:hypothetical protein QTJ16_002197 [Diplocarpon rosae]